MLLTPELPRLLLAALLVLLYLLLCGWVYRRLQHADRRSPVADGWLVAYASQTGAAHELAQHSAELLRVAGAAVELVSLAQLSLTQLQDSKRLLLVLSTYGDGEAPDAAMPFVKRVMSQAPSLTGVHYGLLALGSRHYRHFCHFGRQVDSWLQTHGARRCFDLIEVNDGDSTAVASWRNALAHLTGVQQVADWRTADFSEWRVQSRLLLNPGSQGEPVYYLELASVVARQWSWQAGDLVQIRLSEAEKQREYSIANLPGEGVVALIVRLHRRPDGRVGHVSGWLTQAPLGAKLQLRICAHQSFRIGANQQRPLILIGNGVGLAGLLGHIRQRGQQAHAEPCWLVFGERQAAHDAYCLPELCHYQQQGVLRRLDRVFSRDGVECRYVQDHLALSMADVKSWLERGAALYVCGSLQGMAQAVDAVLRQHLGDQMVDELAQAGRYCRDVY